MKKNHIKAPRPRIVPRNDNKNSTMDLRQFRHLLGGWTQEQAAKAVGVTLKTYKKYERDPTAAPLAVVRLLAILAAGDLGELNPAWKGWNLLQGELVSPENTTFRPGDVRAAGYLNELAKAQRRELLTLRKDAARQEEQQRTDQQHQAADRQRRRVRPTAEGVQHAPGFVLDLYADNDET